MLDIVKMLKLSLNWKLWWWNFWKEVKCKYSREHEWVCFGIFLYWHNARWWFSLVFSWFNWFADKHTRCYILRIKTETKTNGIMKLMIYLLYTMEKLIIKIKIQYIHFKTFIILCKQLCVKQIFFGNRWL